jgi:hypothetical protein
VPTGTTTSQQPLIYGNPAVDIAVVVVIIALLTVIVTQQKIIRARKEVEESHHQVEDLNKPVTLRRRGECTIDTTRDGFQHLIVQVSHIRFFRSFLYFLLRFAFRRILFYFFAEAVVQFFVFHMNTLLKTLFQFMFVLYHKFCHKTITTSEKPFHWLFIGIKR